MALEWKNDIVGEVVLKPTVFGEEIKLKNIVGANTGVGASPGTTFPLAGEQARGISGFLWLTNKVPEDTGSETAANSYLVNRAEKTTTAKLLPST